MASVWQNYMQLTGANILKVSLWQVTTQTYISFLSQNMYKSYGYRHNATLRVFCLSCYIQMPRLGTNKVWILLTWSFSTVVGISVNRPPSHQMFVSTSVSQIFPPNDPHPPSCFIYVALRPSQMLLLVRKITLFLCCWLEYWNKLTLLLLAVLNFLKYLI